MLIDGNALIHRGYHAIPGLTTKTGIPTGAVFGFTSILLRAIKELKPTHIAATFDLAGPTFRHEKFESYKAGRVKAPDDLYEQIPLVKDLLHCHFCLNFYLSLGCLLITKVYHGWLDFIVTWLVFVFITTILSSVLLLFINMVDTEK